MTRRLWDHFLVHASRAAAYSPPKRMLREFAGGTVFFSADPVVSSSIFVGAEREENLIRNDPDKSEFTKVSCFC